MYFLFGFVAWLSIESAYYLYVRDVVYKKVCSFKNKSSSNPNAHVKSLFDLLASLKTYTLNNWVEGIFLNNKSNISLDNFISCMSWFHYYLPITDITPDQSRQVHDVATQLFGQFQGNNPEAKHMDL